MRTTNKFVKGLAYFGVIFLAIISLYTTTLFIISALAGLVLSGFSIVCHSIPLIIQQYIGIFVLLISIPLSFIMWLLSFIKSKKQIKEQQKRFEEFNKEQ